MDQARNDGNAAPSGAASTATGSQYVFNERTEFRIEERVFAPDSFFVQAMPGKTDVFKIVGKLIDFNGEKRMFDMEGNVLFFMTQQFNSARMLQYLLNKRTGEVYTLRKKGFLPGRGRGTILVWRGKGDQGEVVLEIKTSAGRSEFDIFQAGSKVAKIERSRFGAKRLFTGLDSYRVRVEAGFPVDFALMLTACVDEHYTEGQA